MRLSFGSRACAISGFVLSFASFASAGNWTFAPARYGDAAPGLNAVTPANDPYTVYSGVGNAANGQLFLIENTTTPTADDRVLFDTLPEVINPYSTTVPTPRTVTESDVSLGGNLRKLSITLSTTPGSDLWPQGFVDSTTQAPLLAGGFGIGFTGVPSIWPVGSEGLGWNGDLITQADIDIVDLTGAQGGNTGPLPLGTFFNSTTAWNGVFGVIFTDTGPTGVTGFGVTSIKLNITYQTVPEPTCFAIALPLAGLVLRRRR
jgi:hypothetical protein